MTKIVDASFFVDDDAIVEEQESTSNLVNAGKALKDAANIIGKGVTFGQNEKLIAGGNAILDAVLGGKSLGTAYDDRLAEYRKAEKRTQEQAPIASVVGEVAGGVASPISKLQILKKAKDANKIINAGKGIVNTTALGGLYGAGTARDEDLLESTAKGAAFGALGGAVGESLIGATGSLAKTKLVKNLLKNSTEETGAIGNLPAKKTLSKEELLIIKNLKNIPEKDIDEAIKKLATAKKKNLPLYIQEALPNSQLVQDAKYVFNTDAGRNIAQRTLAKRMEAQPDRLEDILSTISPAESRLTVGEKTQNFAKEFLDDIKQKRREAVNPLFKEAEEAAIVPTQKLVELLENPLLQKSVSQAEDVLAVEGKNLNPTARLQEILQNLGSKQKKAGSGLEPDLKLARDLGVVKSAVEKEVGLVNPTLINARKAYAELSENLVGADKTTLNILSKLKDNKIADATKEIFKLEPENIAKLKTAFDKQPDLWKSIVRTHLQEGIETTGEGLSATRKLFNTPKESKKILAALGTKDFKNLKSAVDIEKKITKGHRDVYASSPTTPLQETAKNFEAKVGFLSSLAKDGLIKGSLKEIGEVVKKLGKPEDKVLENLARIYTSTDEGAYVLKKAFKQIKATNKYNSSVDNLAELLKTVNKKSLAPTGSKIIEAEKLPKEKNGLNLTTKKSLAVAGTIIPAGFFIDDAEAEEPETNQKRTSEDLVLDALRQVESGGNPNAVSSAGARGAYQFMPKTAKAYGVNLNDNSEDDDRAGASKYLKDELAVLGDLPSALAAYNAGRPAVLKARKLAGSNNFKEYAKYLPTETRNYVPKINQALEKLLG